MPRFVPDSRPISAQHPIAEFYREEFLKHHRCLQQQRPYYSESAITDVEAALSQDHRQARATLLARQRRPARQLPPQEVRRRDRPFGLVRSQAHTLTRSHSTASTRPPGHRPGRYRCVRRRRAGRAGARCRCRAGAVRPADCHGGRCSASALRLPRHRRGQGRAGDGRRGRAAARRPDSRRPGDWRRREAAVPAGFESIVGGHPLPDGRERSGGPQGAGPGRVARRRRDAARAPLRRRVGADGGAGRRHHPRRQARDDRSGCCGPAPTFTR